MIAESSGTDQPPSRPQTAEDALTRQGMKWSLIGHVGLLVFILFKSLVFPGNSIPYVPTLRVDIVGLPDVLKKDLKAPTASSKEIEKALEESEKKAPKEKEVAAPDEMVLKPKKTANRNKNALARIKALAKMDTSEDSRSAPKIIKGNQLSKGTSLSGDARESAVANYYDSIRDRLQENWALNPLLARQKFSASVQLFIDARGKLVRFKFTKLSGNSQFDDAVRRALQQSQPFSPPPAELKASLLSDGLFLGFPL
jgi:outer membrane biosynthesis protein TonB